MEGYASNIKYLKMWGCVAEVMLPDLKKRKLGYHTSYDCKYR